MRLTILYPNKRIMSTPCLCSSACVDVPEPHLVNKLLLLLQL
jgi:hypothetical protein